MPRLKLAPRERYPFEVRIRVRTTDLNYGGHLGHDRLLALLQEARVEFLAAQGLTELDCGGVSLIMGDAAVVYRGEAFAGDELRVEVAAGEPGRHGFRLFYRMTRVADAVIVALAETGLACFDYGVRELRDLPSELAERWRDA